jgi:hypothetical protein
VVVAGLALKAFTDYMNSKTFTFEYDHAAGFFDKDIWSDDVDAAAFTLSPTRVAPSKRRSVVGLAFVGAACGFFWHSII